MAQKRILSPTRVTEEYVREDIERIIPQDGFIYDYVNSLRGTEVPTSYAMWSCYSLLSAMIKREAWIQWLDRLYANLYVILIGPPGIVKKSTAINHGLAVIRHAKRMFDDVNMEGIKDINIVSGKNSPEAIYEAVIPNGKKYQLFDSEGVPLVDDEGQKVFYHAGSEIYLALSEMASSMNKKDYAQTFIENLLDLYDCVDETDWRTVKRGPIKLQRTHTTFIAATTPRGFVDSLPTSVSGDGFLSRVVLSYEPGTEKIFSEPRLLEGAPDRVELARRLCEVARHGFGEHKLTKSAKMWRDSWYIRFRKDMEQMDERDQSIFSRKPIHMYKLALLTKLQSYSRFEDKTITIDDLKKAEMLLDYTYRNTPGLFLKLEQGEYGKDLDKVYHFIMKKGKATRRQLMQSLRYPAHQLDKFLKHLHQADQIVVLKNGMRRVNIHCTPKEEYTISDFVDASIPKDLGEAYENEEER